MIKRILQTFLGIQHAPQIAGKHDLHPYSAEWDAFLSSAIEAGDVKLVDEYRAEVGGVAVWIANYPHAFGKPFRGLEVLPSLQTRERLHKACVSALVVGAKAARAAQ